MGWTGKVSSPPKLVLDTNVLRDRDFIRWTQSEYHGKVCTSVVSFMELRRQRIHNHIPGEITEFLRKANIEIINYTPRMAVIASDIMSQMEDIQCKTCGKIDWADIMIYSTIEYPPTVLVTRNLKDFPQDRVMTPQQVMESFHR